MREYNITFSEIEIGVLLAAINYFYTEPPYVSEDINKMAKELFTKIEEVII